MSTTSWEHDIEDWRLLVKQAPDLIITIDRDATVLYVNHLTQGSADSSSVGRSSLDFVPRHEHEAYLARIERVFSTGESETYELVGMTASGAETRYVSTMSPVVQNGTTIAANIVSRDIAARTCAEQSIVDSLDREREAADQLRQLDALQRDFTAKVVHDLRTPITIIDGFARTLVDPDVDVSPVQRDEFLALMSDASSRLIRLVDDILEMYRIEAPGFHVDVRPCDAGCTLTQAIDSFGPAKSRIQLRVPETPVDVLADERRHEQVIVNLLSNAFKYSAADTPIEVSLTTEGNEARIDVVDHGFGIPPEHIDLLFRKFSQLPSRSDQPLRGSGLGLYICRSILEAHGGRIDVHSSPGLGSTFSYYMPLAVGSSPAEARPATRPNTSA